MQHAALRPSQQSTKPGQKPAAKGQPAAHPASGKDYGTGSAAVGPHGDEGPAKMQGGQEYTVVPGDSLSGIAAAKLGNPGRWKDIWELNKSRVPNPDLIHPGLVLRLPPAGAPKSAGTHDLPPAQARPAAGKGKPEGEKKPAATPAAHEPTEAKKPNDPAAHPTTPAAPAQARTYTVKGGDTLAAIALKEMGASNAWPSLWAANKALIHNPHDIRPGMVLRIPKAGEHVAPDPKPAPAHKPANPGGTHGPEAGPKPGKGSGAKGGKDDDKSMAPKGPHAVGRTPLEKAMADVYNTKGEFIKSEAAKLGIETGVAAACLMCESGGAGYVGGRLKIRFEPGIFKGYTGKFVADSHNSQAAEYDAFERAQHVHKARAYDSISMGAAQIMGFNATTIGYGSAKEMFDEFQASEKAQLGGFFSFVASQRVLVKAARGKDWATFAYHYNGPGYKANAYDTKLASYYAAWQHVMARLPKA